jgi:lipocalin
MGGQQSNIGPVRDRVDLGRYSGVWYEIARSRELPFEPPDVTDVRSTYKWDERTFTIANEALRDGVPVRWSATVTGSFNEFDSSLRVRDDKTGALAMYRILELDFEHYQWAIVAGAKDGCDAWIIARTPSMDDALYLELTLLLSDFHAFDPRNLLRTEHTLARDTASAPVEGCGPVGDAEGRAVVVEDRQTRHAEPSLVRREVVVPRQSGGAPVL